MRRGGIRRDGREEELKNVKEEDLEKDDLEKKRSWNRFKKDLEDKSILKNLKKLIFEERERERERRNWKIWKKMIWRI